MKPEALHNFQAGLIKSPVKSYNNSQQLTAKSVAENTFYLTNMFERKHRKKRVTAIRKVDGVNGAR